MSIIGILFINRKFSTGLFTSRTTPGPSPYMLEHIEGAWSYTLGESKDTLYVIFLTAYTHNEKMTRSTLFRFNIHDLYTIPNMKEASRIGKINPWFYKILYCLGCSPVGPPAGRHVGHVGDRGATRGPFWKHQTARWTSASSQMLCACVIHEIHIGYHDFLFYYF